MDGLVQHCSIYIANANIEIIFKLAKNPYLYQ